MLPDPFNAPFDVSGSAQTIPWTLITVGPGTSIRKSALTAGKPRTMRISHSVVGKGSSKRDRHMVRIESYPVVDELEVSNAQPAAIYLVADIPSNGFAAADIEYLWNQFVGMLRGGSGDACNAGVPSIFWNRFLAGEV